MDIRKLSALLLVAGTVGCYAPADDPGTAIPDPNNSSEEEEEVETFPPTLTILTDKRIAFRAKFEIEHTFSEHEVEEVEFSAQGVARVVTQEQDHVQLICEAAGKTTVEVKTVERRSPNNYSSRPLETGIARTEVTCVEANFVFLPASTVFVWRVVNDGPFYTTGDTYVVDYDLVDEDGESLDGVDYPVFGGPDGLENIEVEVAEESSREHPERSLILRLENAQSEGRVTEGDSTRRVVRVENKNIRAIAAINIDAELEVVESGGVFRTDDLESGLFYPLFRMSGFIDGAMVQGTRFSHVESKTPDACRVHLLYDEPYLNTSREGHCTIEYQLEGAPGPAEFSITTVPRELDGSE